MAKKKAVTFGKEVRSIPVQVMFTPKEAAQLDALREREPRATYLRRRGLSPEEK